MFSLASRPPAFKGTVSCLLTVTPGGALPPQNLGEKSLEVSQALWVVVRPKHSPISFPSSLPVGSWLVGDMLHGMGMGKGAEGPWKEMCLQLPFELPECPLCSNLICKCRATPLFCSQPCRPQLAFRSMPRRERLFWAIPAIPDSSRAGDRAGKADLCGEPHETD